MPDISIEDRLLALRLGLGSLERAEPCHGYANLCLCAACVDRESRMEHLAETCSFTVACNRSAFDSAEFMGQAA